jgi:hypothetical protein
MKSSFVVTVGFDEEERRYYVLSSDVPGLNVEADTFEEFVQSVRDLVPQLAEHARGAKLKFEREIVMA